MGSPTPFPKLQYFIVFGIDTYLLIIKPGKPVHEPQFHDELPIHLAKYIWSHRVSIQARKFKEANANLHIGIFNDSTQSATMPQTLKSSPAPAFATQSLTNNEIP